MQQVKAVIAGHTATVGCIGTPVPDYTGDHQDVKRQILHLAYIGRQ